MTSALQCKCVRGLSGLSGLSGSSTGPSPAEKELGPLGDVSVRGQGRAETRDGIIVDVAVEAGGREESEFVGAPTMPRRMSSRQAAPSTVRAGRGQCQIYLDVAKRIVS